MELKQHYPRRGAVVPEIEMASWHRKFESAIKVCTEREIRKGGNLSKTLY